MILVAHFFLQALWFDLISCLAGTYWNLFHTVDERNPVIPLYVCNVLYIPGGCLGFGCINSNVLENCASY